jgi:hypothetical protein
VTEPVHAYILGLLWADGHIRNTHRTQSVVLSTTSPDVEHFRPIMLRTGRWGCYSKPSRNEGWKNAWVITTTNHYLVEHLSALGYCSKSSSPRAILDTIPSHLQCYWYLGLIDGDGCVCVDPRFGTHEIQIAGPADQDWSFLSDLCKRLSVEYRIDITTNERGKGSVFRVNGRRPVYALGDYIWGSGTDLALPRKQAAYMTIRDKALKLSSRFEGVSRVKARTRDPWKAQLPTRLGRAFVGYFPSEEEAYAAIQKATSSAAIEAPCAPSHIRS